MKAGQVLMLQAVVIIYSISTVIAKFVSAEVFFSPRFFALLFLEVAVLGVYALLWQQMIKKADLSVAYANKATTLFYSTLFGVFLFSEQVKITSVIGIVMIAAGVFFINTTGRKGGGS